jgi:hypothetical protein
MISRPHASTKAGPGYAIGADVMPRDGAARLAALHDADRSVPRSVFPVSQALAERTSTVLAQSSAAKGGTLKV